MIEQGATWDEIIVTANQGCWFILKNKEVFGTACEQLAANESIILTSERPKSHKTDCWFTADNPTVLTMGTTDAVAKPAGGPIHIIPPLNG
jgi:ABC-type molybdate transport system substrate-binding protein